MQACSQEVSGGGGGDRLILLKAFIRGPKYESGGGREVRQVPLAFSGPNTKRETPSGLMHFYKYHN